MMFRDLLGPIDGIGVYQITALLLFLGAFIYLVIRGFRMNREDVHYLKRLPLDPERVTKTGEEKSG